MLAPFARAATSEPAVIARWPTRLRPDWAEITDVYNTGTLVVTLARDRADLGSFRTRHRKGIAVSQAQRLRPRWKPGICPKRARGAVFRDEGASVPAPRAGRSDRSAGCARGSPLSRSRSTPQDHWPARYWIVAVLLPQPPLSGLARLVRGEMVDAAQRRGDTSRALCVCCNPAAIPVISCRAGGWCVHVGATPDRIEPTRPRDKRARLLGIAVSGYALHSCLCRSAALIRDGGRLAPRLRRSVPARWCNKAPRADLNGLFRHGYLMAPCTWARQAGGFSATPD